MSIERFPPNSRYAGVPTAELSGPDGEKIVYLRRRFIPDPATLVTVGEVQVQGGDRLAPEFGSHRLTLFHHLVQVFRALVIQIE